MSRVPNSGSRPKLACEISADRVLAGRVSENGGHTLEACASSELAPGQRGSRPDRDQPAATRRGVRSGARHPGQHRRAFAGRDCRAARCRGPGGAARFRDSALQARRSRRRGPLPAEEIPALRRGQGQGFLPCAAFEQGRAGDRGGGAGQCGRGLRSCVSPGRLRARCGDALHAGGAGSGQRAPAVAGHQGGRSHHQHRHPGSASNCCCFAPWRIRAA